MRVLVIGGGGYVAGLVLPALAQQHALRVFDLHAPADASCEYMSGSVTDLDALLRAAEGMESVLYMAMGAQAFGTSTGITTNLDVNIKVSISRSTPRSRPVSGTPSTPAACRSTVVTS